MASQDSAPCECCVQRDGHWSVCGCDCGNQDDTREAQAWCTEQNCSVRIAILEAERDELAKQLQAAVAYAGILSIELGDVIGIALAHGFDGWPSHIPVGNNLRAFLQLDSDEITAAGQEVLDAALATEAEQQPRHPAEEGE